jgi:hypothetical protein
MTFAERSKGESHQRTSECLKEDARPMLPHWASVRSNITETAGEMSSFRSVSAAKCRKVCPDVATHLEKTTANARYLRLHHEQLLEKYGNQWVAIAGDRVVGHAPDLTELVKSLAREGFTAADVMTHFFSTSEQIFIL